MSQPQPQTKIGQKLALLIPSGGAPGGAPPAASAGAGGQPPGAAAASQAAGAAGGGGMKMTLSPQTLSQSGVDPSQLTPGASIQIQADAQVLGMGPQGATIMVSDLQISPGQGSQSGPGGASPGGSDGDDDDQEYKNAWQQGPPQS